MKKIAAAFLAIATIFFISCGKEKGCKNVNPTEEDAEMQAYMSSQGITGTKHPSGLYYQIIAPGGSSRPVSTSRVYVRYVGKTFDGNEFDSQNVASNTGFTLYNLIAGWQIGIPLIGKGGRILLVVPSSLAYGCNGAGDDIPANAPLYFEIDLVDFL